MTVEAKRVAKPLSMVTAWVAALPALLLRSVGAPRPAETTAS